MTQQLSIDFTPSSAPYQRRSVTSRAAAVSVEPRTGTQRAIVLAFLRGCGTVGATDEQMQALIPLGANTQRPRRVELVRARLVVDSGTVRSTATGSPASVWVAAEHAGGF
jgi:hypothetical protein